MSPAPPRPMTPVTAEPRTDSDVLLKTLTLTFGGKPYEVDVLRMKAAARWRKEYFERTKDLSTSMLVDNIDDKGQLAKSIGNALTGALLAFPEKIPELVFSYAPSLPKEEIEAQAYDQEFSRAFAQIWQVAFAPFLASLGTVLEMQRAQATQSASSANSN
jgi:hypothetical protein